MENKKILGTSLIIIISLLMVISLAMIASVSFPKGQKEYGNSYYFLIRHGIWLVIGLAMFIFTSKFDYRKYKKWSGVIYIIGVILLVLVLAIGKEVNGAKRWIGVGAFSIQPSEFAKVILIISLSGVMFNFTNKKKIYNSDIHSWKLSTNMGVLIMIYALLVYLEKSFSSTLQIILIGIGMIYLVAKFHQTILISLFGIIFGIMGVILTPYRLKRITGYAGSSEGVYQEKQSLIAIGSGGLFGKGYGVGYQKNFYLPEIHTDYIFSGYAEEMGFFGSIVLIFIYVALLSIIIITIFKIKDKYARYILSGIFIMFSVQIFGNLSVVLGLIPSTGITLPILSYGGSTTISVMTALGIVYNIIKSLYTEENNKKIRNGEL